MITTTHTVTVSDKSFTYQLPWNGQRLELATACPYVAFDTETEVVNLTLEVPRLALAAASTGREHVLIQPGQLAEFILKHAEARFIFHNVAFDFWVVDKHLCDRGEEEARRTWWDICHQNRMHDTMLLDVLIRLAEGRVDKVRGSDRILFRNLAQVAEEHTSLEITKENPYRERFAEILGKDWEEVEEGFFQYAIKDVIVTLRAYLSMTDAAERIMREHGYDPGLSLNGCHTVRPDALKKFGFLTEAVQVKGAVALAQVTRNGMALDEQRVQDLHAAYRERLNDIIAAFQRDYPGVIKLDRDGLIQLNAKSQTPAVNENYLRQLLVNVVQEIETKTGVKIAVPMTAKGKISASAKLWAEHADKHPLLKLWIERENVSKLCEFFSNLKGKVVHPRYNVLLRTGRTSCESPNVQQIPRTGGFRELFIPSAGHLLLAIDYAYIELRTLAAVCEAQFGYSKLADTIRAGTDPHCYTAAMLLSMPLDQFMALKNTPDQAKNFKEYRQNAKAVNFGVPGGLGALSLVDYARSTFKVDMNLDQATAKRKKLITDIYPELNEKDGYLADNSMVVLARNLKTRVEECWKLLDWDGTWNKSAVFCVQKVVRGKPIKKDGTPYKDSFVHRIWDALHQLNRNGCPRLGELLDTRQGCEELYRLLFRQDVVTLTGRVRGGVEYTQAKNTPFQSLAADGAKLAIWDLLYHGFRVTGFVHDEVLIELPEQDGCVTLAACEKVQSIVCEAMAQVTGLVPIEAEYTVSRCWSKEAKLIVEGDKVMAWQPAKAGPIQGAS